ncbi:MAG TPA: ATP-binding protein [Firmicutes bacterium]|nr:ATP-binding protein [Bacillota bacterium]
MNRNDFFKDLYQWYFQINKVFRNSFSPMNIILNPNSERISEEEEKQNQIMENWAAATEHLVDVVRSDDIFKYYREAGGSDLSDDEHKFFLFYFAGNIFANEILPPPQILIMKMYNGDMQKLQLYTRENPLLIRKILKKENNPRRLSHCNFFQINKEILNSIIDFDYSNLMFKKDNSPDPMALFPGGGKANVLNKSNGSVNFENDVILPEKTKEKILKSLIVFQNLEKLNKEWGDTEYFAELKNMVILFHGEPGVGKTFTANAISNYLNVPLYSVDIASTQSMWVGGNEKLMMKIFEDYRKKKSGILLFDEADSLFMNRVGGIARSVDAMHNRVINILLREIEKTEGIIILTTNLKVNFDSAFERRIRIKVEFGKPDKKLRKKIWEQKICRKNFPIGDNVDFDKLSEFSLTGGEILNAINNALRTTAYRFAQDGNGKVMQSDLIEAVKDEISFRTKEEKKVGFVNEEKDKN